MPQRLIIFVIIPVLLLLAACGDDRTLTVYSLKKVNPETSFGHDWLPLNPRTYQISDQAVVSKTAGFLSKYDDCIVLSLKDWKCSYSDGSGEFGFKSGEYWVFPIRSDQKFVSRLKYNLVRCQWAISDKHSSYLWGVVGCVFGWT